MLVIDVGWTINIEFQYDNHERISEFESIKATFVLIRMHLV